MGMLPVPPLTSSLIKKAYEPFLRSGTLSQVNGGTMSMDRKEKLGSSPCLRPAHHIDSKGLRSGIDPCRIPHKMLAKPASHKEEPDAWILSVSKPGLHYQNSG